MARSKRGSGRVLRPTAGKEWRSEREEAQEGYVKELWSGRVARLRPPDLAALMVAGRIPDPLTNLVHLMLFYGYTAEVRQELDKLREPEQQTGQELETRLALYEAVCKAMFVEPCIVDDPQADNEISIDDVDLVDKMLVWELACGTTVLGVGHLKTFRVESIRDVEPVPDQPVEPVRAERVDDGADE